MDYTVEMYRIDRRTKEGKVLVYKQDYTNVDYAQMERMYPRRPRYIVQIHETYVERRNLMSGDLVRERYDTPHCCSVASESYWSQ